MNNKELLSTARRHLLVLCSDISERTVGSKGNREATCYFKAELHLHGWHTEETLLNVIDWKSDGATLQCARKSYEVFSSPYSTAHTPKDNLAIVSYDRVVEIALAIREFIDIVGT